MPLQVLDMTIAFKTICLSVELSGTEKRIAGAIIDSFNRKTGQCDPSLGRIAHLLGMSRRTVIRGLHRIEKARFIRKVRHGGHAHRNSYEPNWARCREVEAEWNARRKTRHWNSDEANVSLLRCQTRHVVGDKADTQTFLNNHSNNPKTDGPNLEIRNSPTIAKGDKGHSGRGFGSIGTSLPKLTWASRDGVRSRDAALAAAERRWSGELNNRYAAEPAIYAEVIETIDGEMQKAATAAEMQRRGAGLEHIINQLRIRHLQRLVRSIDGELNA